MRSLLALSVSALCFAALVTSCGQPTKPAAPAASAPHATGKARIPAGAKTKLAVTEKFFAAYKAHNRAAAAEVATEAALAEVRWDPKSGTPEGLQVADETHIYYVGGSLELTMAKNPAGLWYVKSIESTAD